MSSPAAATDPATTDSCRQISQNIYVGTAGFTYPHWRRDVFYPRLVKAEEELKHYSGVFPACEINATYHGMVNRSSFEKWATQTPRAFKFVFKARMEITHKNRLVDVDELWERFTEGISHVKDKQGPILVQLPPTFKKDVARFDMFLSMAARVSPTARLAVEFRNAEWFCDEVYNVAKKHGACLVENVTPDNSFPRCRVVTTDFSYIRMHKSIDYAETNYSQTQLAEVAKLVAERRRKLKIDQYVFFLNDIDGHGPRNGQTLMDLICKELDIGKESLVEGWRPADLRKGGQGKLTSFFSSGGGGGGGDGVGSAAARKKASVKSDDITAGSMSPQKRQHDSSATSLENGEEPSAKRPNADQHASTSHTSSSSAAAERRAVGGQEGKQNKPTTPKKGTILAHFKPSPKK